MRMAGRRRAGRGVYLGGDLMSSKSPLSRKATDGKKRSPAYRGRNGNGNGNGHGEGDGNVSLAEDGRHDQSLHGRNGLRPRPAPRELDRKTLLAALLAFRKGDFSVRLPIDLDGIDGKIADAFNDVIELNERMADELERLSRVVGKEGKISQRAEHRRRSPAPGSDVGQFGQRADQRPGAPDQRNRPRHRRRRQGRPLADDGAGDRRPPARGRIPPHRQDRQHDGGAARLASPRK